MKELCFIRVLDGFYKESRKKTHCVLEGFRLL